MQDNTEEKEEKSKVNETVREVVIRSDDTRRESEKDAKTLEEIRRDTENR